ncbi:MAG: tetratricopeptide repeat protein [Dokdonella sp.]
MKFFSLFSVARCRSLSIAAMVLGALLASCSEPSPPARVAAIKPDDPLVTIAAIRAAGEKDDSVIQVAPLRDPAVEGFLAEAHGAETQRKFDAEAAALERALKLAPDAPDILQLLAEAEIARGNVRRAEELAMKSFAAGPRLGALCARNWQTLVETRTVLNDPVTRKQAEQRVKDCRKNGPVRM